MATEKRLEEIPAQLILSNGDITGRIAVTDASIFTVKQVITLFSDSVSPIEYQVKHVIPGFIYLGRPDKPITEYSKLSQFTLVDNTKISAREQSRSTISQPDIQRAVYAEEPTVAIRTILVDKMGNDYRKENPIPVQLSDGSITIDTLNVDVQLTDKDTPGRTHDTVRIGDGTNELEINDDGSINVAGLNLEGVATEATLLVISNNLAIIAAAFEQTAPFLLDEFGNKLVNNNGITLTEFP